MVLRCECGSSVELTNQSYPEGDGLAFETYECTTCGKIGTFTFGNRDGQHVERMGGCLTTA